MKERSDRAILAGLLSRVRWRILCQTAVAWCVRAGVILLPLAAVVIAADQRWHQGNASLVIALVLLVGLAVASVAVALSGLGARVHSALTLDQSAQLKDRISSAWEFLDQPNPSEAQRVQIQDAIQRAQTLDCRAVLRMRWPRASAALPIVVVLFLLSFLVPPLTNPALAHTHKDAVKVAQLQMLAELKKELAAKETFPKEMEEILKKLDQVQRRFEQGEIAEREVMLELGRLDESLKTKLNQLGLENMESELDAMVPHLSANAATLDVAQAMKDRKLDQAAEGLKDLADQVSADKLSKEELKKLAAQLGAAAAKLEKQNSDSPKDAARQPRTAARKQGQNSNDSFSDDLADASEALEQSDAEGFAAAAQSMGGKLRLLSKIEGMQAMSRSLEMGKAGMGQGQAEAMGSAPGSGPGGNQPGPSGNQPGPGGPNPGGLNAGTAASGNPLGDPTRLKTGVEKMLQISGAIGKGPMQTETEVTGGQASESKLSMREVLANYAAAAEEVIEKEDIPLSQRYHVKRYFQAIKPQE